MVLKQSLSKKSSLPKLAVFVFTLFIIWWSWQQWNFAKSTWEVRGDAHFYAACAEHYFYTGENRWFELYPIALKENSGIHMSFSSFAFPFWISLWIKMGYQAPNATLMATLSAYLSMVLSLGYWVKRFAGWQLATFAMALPLCFSKMSIFAVSGGAEALSMLFLVNAVGLLFLSRESSFTWLICITVSVLGAWIRPHNQLFLYGLFFPAIFSQPSQRLKYLAIFFLGVLTFHVMNFFVIDHSLKFSYLFSFLVGTEIYPQHSLFREYFSNGFQTQLLLEHKDQIFDKIHIAIRLLKLNWPWWMPQVLVMLLVLRISKNLGIWLCLFSLLCSIIFLAAMGHLVPRYWEMLQPVTYLCTFFMFVSRFESIRTEFSRANWLVLLSLLMIGSFILKNWENYEPRDVNFTHVPTDLMEKIQHFPWVACNQPAAFIDLWKRPILLLPEKVSTVEDIHNEVQHLEALILAPNYELSEYAAWVSENEHQLRLAWNVYEYDDWVLFIRRSLEK